MDGIGPYFSEFIRFVAEIEPSLGFGSAYRQKYSLWEPTAFPLDSTGAFSFSIQIPPIFETTWENGSGSSF